ncbi:cytochrome ubiquinol oxidase subunit I [Campylobacter sp. RM9344]|uniref:Cytochrome ubiquinol oxidase subunit I n=1 Tax=Campylobacter californiensis TaxID=1032243 RepID=A0AAW3ZWQ2_9BACT|nr:MULTISPECIES: cytochrome ubiquinol oxidase subunit I [unclassified Campylobacter]MBE2985030.1 cytochrome ubiquinol oxidase subunit I [Campylobacter sp. RM6883]MBE2995226.1 cytochrome ubiquinol oxidase subunit I [Campylobacter sp. RM6913]MBE3029517.1 cytochrome ubiquinol oxidase subunit I [Campylobacter sp. RM9344]MBE3608219.1 cytochrome ubiquinol oxidase subunit I [Campylobacter sp. RM9337]QCD51614.1 cyanide-insensitive cytochrome oxidase CioAB, subunit I [Campylobacter sp. RM6914]
MAELASVDWSRAQFALTALYHFLFVPLTLGLSFIIAIMESIYVKTGNKEWRDITKFWLKLFGINFAIGVATGIIMEFEFGTNWANYSWFVGDIFGAPLAIEGLLAFFMESTFFAVMFFGWDKVSKKFHLISTWLVAIGSNLSALWILVANGWMQYPIGMKFNPDTARMEMENFFEVALSPVGIIKFLHTVTSGYVISALFVIGISAWFILKGRHLVMAKKSMIVATSFGLITSLFLLFSGDESGYQAAKAQPMKLAAMEGLYKGDTRQGLVAMGILDPSKKPGDDKDPFLIDLEVPYMLSLLGTRSIEGFIPGIDDLVYGNETHGIESVASKMEKGKIAADALKIYKEAKKSGDTQTAQDAAKILDENMKFLGYNYLDKPEDAIPPVATTFYSFHLMVTLGGYFIALFLVVTYLCMANEIENFPKLLWLCVLSIPLGYIAAEAGWIVAEVGRQPWAIQDLMTVGVGATNLADTNVKISFTLFAVLFTTLLIAEIKIMSKQIKIGFESHV